MPSLPTSTLLTVGFDFLTSSATLAFSISVKLLGSVTGVTDGSLTALSLGVAAVASFGSLASDVFPDGSVAVAVTPPAGRSTVGAIVALPLLSATPSPILLPSLSNNLTVDPGSAVTSTGVLVPALPVRSVVTTGFAGAVVSGVDGVVA